MNNAFPKDIIDCMKDCIMSIFWPKKEIIDFFKSCGCTSRDMISESELIELHRAAIVDKVFDNLRKRDDSGLGQFRSMLKSLTEWDRFDPYYFKELKKLDEGVAKRNISHLKLLQESRDEKIKEINRQREIQEKNRQEATNIEELKNIFLNLYNNKNKKGATINNQKRGYLFEDFLKELFQREEIEITEPFKVTGEQIDGSFKYDGEHYLVEAKWQDAWSASDSLYQFAMKAEGKMYGRGFFISVNGFSTDSVQALSTGKAIRTILIDGGDLVLVIEGIFTLKQMLDSKIKAAQTMGRIYVNIGDLSNKTNNI